MNKKDRNSLVQYYKTFRPADYKDERLDPREVFYIEVIEAIADLYLKTQRKFVHQTLVLKSMDKKGQDLTKDDEEVIYGYVN